MSDRTSRRTTFDIIDWSGMYVKLQQEYDDLKGDGLSTRHAVNFAFTAWHLADWIWSTVLKEKGAEQLRIFGREFRDLNDFQEHLTTEHPDLAYVRDICNSAKHSSHDGSVVDQTIRVARTWGSGAYGSLSFGGSERLIVVSGGVQRDFASIADSIVEYGSRVAAAIPGAIS